jgi:CubicO group peptidase (beta-lactamase class C family)
MKKKIFLLAVTIFIVLGVFLYLKIFGPTLPLPDEFPQKEYAIDKLPGCDDYPFELDKEILAEIVNKIEVGDYGNIHSLIIIHNDSLVLEKYFQGWTRHMLHPCFSVTKSFTSALTGIAIEKGYINGVDEKILSFFPEYSDFENLDKIKESITLKDVLTMTAGFTWNEMSTPYYVIWRIPNPKNDAIKLGFSTDLIKSVLDLPMSNPPGTKLVYNGACTLLLSGIIKNKTGQSAEEFAEINLFNPLGITNWKWETGPNEITLTAGGLYLHPVDMAMFGYLYLNNGIINDKQIIPDKWVKESTAKKMVFDNVNKYVDGFFSYGYQWWGFTDDFFDRLWQGTPPRMNDMYTANGLGGQFIVVIPHLDMVYLSTGWNPQKPWLRGLLFNACLNAIKEK